MLRCFVQKLDKDNNGLFACLLIDIFPGIQLSCQNEDDMNPSQCCLVAIGRLQMTSPGNPADLIGVQNQFISRHSKEGKFSFVDQRVTNLLGFVPTDLLGKSCYDFFHPEDQDNMKENFDQGRLLRSHHRRICKKILLLQFSSRKTKRFHSPTGFEIKTLNGFGSELKLTRF